jgi:hypothetical protein
MLLRTPRILFLLFLAVALSLVTACNTNSKDDKTGAVARVYDDYLYLADIQDIVPENTSSQDSIRIMDDYIDNWIRQKVLLNQAEKNLTKEQKDFTRQLEDYRNSLIIFTYQEELIRQNIDTVVSEKEIVDYYNANTSDFELKDNIVKVWYVKLNKNEKVNVFSQLLRSDKPNDRKKLLDMAAKYAVNAFLDDQNWLVFNDILKEIPIETYNQEEYLKNNRFIQIEDSLYTYLLNIKGFMIKESVSPLSFEKENIRSIIINKRKIKLIEDMQQSIYNDALKAGDFEKIPVTDK